MTRHPGMPSAVRVFPAWRGGFTLIELMVVIGIMGMVLALGVPPFMRSMQKDSLRQAVSDITEGCAAARAQAILRGVPVDLVFRVAATLEVSVESGPNTGNDQAGSGGASGEVWSDTAAAKSPHFSAHVHEDVEVKLLDVNFKNQLILDTDDIHVHFYPNGTSDEFTIVVQTGRGIRKISLECVTGLANMEVIR